MMVEAMQALYGYNRWANHRTCEAARPLERGEFAQDLRGGHSSVRGTLVHIMWGEWLWLQRGRGASPKQVFVPDDYPSVAAIEARWRTIEGDQEEYIGRLTAEALRERVSYENVDGERWEYTRAQMLQHVVNHSSYHRGQIAMLLRQLGKTPPATDFLVHVDEAAWSAG